MKRILLGYDGSEPSERALARACALLDPDGKLFVLNVIHALSAGVRSGQSTEPLAREEQHRLLDAVSVAARELGREVFPIAEKGDPGEVFAQQAEAHRADLVVVGTRGLGLAKRFLLGSVSDAVARHATCDVLLVR